jgi:hypothetical protein
MAVPARGRDRELEQSSKAVTMDKATMELLARRAGLDKALAEFPEDVAAAAEQAGGSLARLKAPAAPQAEPWPPMRAGTGL